MTVNEKIFKIKKFLNISTTDALAELLGISGAAIRNWVKRDEIPENNIFKLKELGVDMQQIEKSEQNESILSAKSTKDNPKNESNLVFSGFVKPKGDDIYIPELGTAVHAGNPAEFFTDIVSMVNATRHLHDKSWYVTVKGRSMEGAGIREGMKLLIDGRLQPASGNLVIAWVGGVVTLKRYKTNGGEFLLEPEPTDDNEEHYDAIKCDEKVTILGVAVRFEGELL